MRLPWAVCCVALVLGVPTVARSAGDDGTRARFVLNATATLGPGLCFWGGVPYSDGGQVRDPSDSDPHVMSRFFTCRAGSWVQD